MLYFEDASGAIDLQKILSSSVNWKSTAGTDFNFGFTSSVYWFHFTVEVADNPVEWFLEIDRPLMDEIGLYCLRPDGGMILQQAGDHFPFYAREIIDRNFIFPQPTAPGIYQYYMWMKTSASLNFNPTFRSWNALLERFETQIPLFWFYHGILFIMALYNLFLFISIRENSYLHYALFIFSWTFFALTLNGFAFQYLWPENIWWANNCLPFFMCLTIMWCGLFARSYADTRKNYPKTDRILLYGVIAPNGIWSLASLLLPCSTANIVAAALTVPSILVYYLVNIYLYRQGSKAARYWVIAFTIICIGVLLFVLKTFGVLPVNFITKWSLQIGAVCLVVLLSLGLADKINTMKNEMSLLNRNLFQRNRQIQSLNEELETRVLERTEQYKTANKALKNSLETLKMTQGQLIQSEKMAALGNLVAGVAHEINTPLGVGLTAASLLADKTQAQKDRFDDDTLKRSELEKYLNLASETTGMILSNLERAAELVRSFKQAAVDQSSENKRRFNIKSYIEELLVSLKPRLKRGRHTITLNCADTIEINSDPGVLSQILTNLVMNSIIHGFEGKESGTISIFVYLEADSLVLSYADDGKGMDEETLRKMFDPFFTTKRTHGGTGLGMHIVYNLITQTVGGHVECTSTPGKGVVFLIRIPLDETHTSK